MIIDTVDTSAGTFSGRYNSLVGVAEREYLLLGRFGAKNTLGWTVAWTNKDTPDGGSTTAWSGQMQMVTLSPGGEPTPTILSTWLLTHSTEPKNDWDSTNVGTDIFHLEMLPTEEKVRLAKQLRRSSHPREA